MPQFERKRVRVNNIEISYVETGNRSHPTVVFVHGMAETSISCWENQLKALSTDYHCFAVDIRGHGESTVGDADGTLAQLGNDLLTFQESTTGPATLVGFSLGATIALWAAAQRSPSVHHVIAIAGSSVINKQTAEFFRDKAKKLAEYKLDDVHAELSAEAQEMFVSHPDRSSSYGHRRIAAIGEGRGYANTGLAMASMRETPLQPLLADITCSVDVVGGEHDKWCPRKAADIILDGLPESRATYSEIPGTGHLVTIDEPEALNSFLAELLGKANTLD